MKTFVFNGWAADPATWDLTTFARERVFDYIEQLRGIPEQVLAEEDAYVLVGFSMGGTFAMQTLMRHPEKVCGLVLVSATARMMAQVDEGWEGMSPRRRQALLYGTELTHPCDPSPLYDGTWLRRGLDYLEATDIRAELKATVAASERLRHLPVALLQSERDGIVRPANVDFLKAVFPQAEVLRVPGNEHTLPLVCPRRVDEAVRRVVLTARNGKW